MHTYKHTQPGWITLAAMGAAFLIVLAAILLSHDRNAWLVAAVLGVCTVLFSTLTVTVDDQYVRAVFTLGVFRMRVKAADIVSASAVRNEWWYGFGIHGFWGKGWLINISGLDAVELKLKNGMVYRIGTDEPQKLLQAVQQLIKA